jgi:hypothetical protein
MTKKGHKDKQNQRRNTNKKEVITKQENKKWGWGERESN